MPDLPLSVMACRLPGGRAGSSLTGALDLHSVARHPVARWDLPAPATRRVSCGPKTGELTGPSWQASGRESIAPLQSTMLSMGRYPNERCPPDRVKISHDKGAG